MTDDAAPMEDASHEDLPQGPAGRLTGLAQAAAYGDLEAAWIETLEDEAFDAEAAGSVLVALLEQESVRARRAAESLLWMALEAWTEGGRAADGRRVLRRLGDRLPDAPHLHEAAAAVYRAKCPDAAGLDTLLAMTVGREGLALGTAVERLETLLDLVPGTFVVDPRRKHPGCVLGVDPARGVLKVSFGASERGYDAESVVHLEPGNDHDFRALVAFAPERLVAMADDDPAHLARIVLEAHGPTMKFREFKAALDPVIKGRAWAKWWSGARDRVKRSPLIEMTESTQPALTLRDVPVSFEKERLHGFLAAEGERRLELALTYLDETGHNPEAEAVLLTDLATRLAETAARADTAAERLGALAVLDEMHQRHPNTVDAPRAAPADVAGNAGMAGAVAALANEAVVRGVLVYLRRALPESWPEVFGTALTMSRLPAACEHLAAELVDAGHADRLTAAGEHVLHYPHEAPTASFWLWTTVMAGRYADALAGVDPVTLTIRFLLSADRLGRMGKEDRSLRPVVAQVRSALDVRANSALQRVLEQADDTQAKDIRAAVDRNTLLTDALRSRLLDLIRRVHPEHFAVKQLEPWEEEDVVWTSEKALRHQEELYGDLVTRQMAENAQAIGDAAALGDVSDNAEFTAALEEQQRLSEKAQQMQTDIGKARVIPPSMGASDTVTVGSKIRTRAADTGRDEFFTFLGPWDTDVENRVFYYRAPLAMAFMGKAVGDTVAFGDGANRREWEVLEIAAGI